MAKANKTEGWATREVPNYLNMSNEERAAAASGPPPLAKGVYKGKIVEADATTAGEKDNPTIKIKFEVTATFDGEKPEGSKFCYSYVTCTNEMSWKVLQLAAALGIDPPLDFGFDTLTEYSENLVGQECYARIQPKEYQGRKSNDLQRFLTEDAAREEVYGKSEAEVVPMRRGSRKAAAAE